MSKMTRKQKKEEEARILAEMEAALREADEADEADGLASENAEPTESAPASEPVKKRSRYDGLLPEKIHCRRCGTLMEDGVCPSCGFKMYTPMADEKRNKIRWILAIVLLAAFLVFFVVTQAVKAG